MSPDRNATSPSLSQTPNCTNDMKDLTLNIGGNSTNTLSSTDIIRNSNTVPTTVATIPNNNNTTLVPVPASYSPSVFNSAYSPNAFDTKNSLTSLAQGQLNAHHAATYGGYPGSAAHNAMEFAAASGYAGGFYPTTAMASVLGKSPFSVPSASTSPGDKNKNNKRSNTGQ